MIVLGQIGIGAWGRNLLRNFAALSDCAVKTACDKSRAVLEAVKAEYKSEIGCVEDPADIFADDEIEGVVIATLPNTHAQLAIKAMESGKHVFVEKPLAMSAKEGLEIKKAAEKYKKICMVGHILLYHPALVALKKYIGEGSLGHIYYIYSTRVNLGKVRNEENALWSLTSHDISAIMHLIGAFPQHVATSGSSYLRKDIADVVFVDLGFKNDVIAHIHASWLDPHKIRQLTVVGSKKMAVFDDMSAEKLRIYDKGVDQTAGQGSYETFLTLRSGDIFAPKIDTAEPLRIECQEFVDCIEQGRIPLADVDNGIEVLRVLEAAQESLDGGGAKVHVR
ncbi:MAG: Gfo/Idh/MocA family oxidoreductase [Candidatus Omnitrophica bacterium]|nr:Gfo/Idh/MocA family oxidoreductase [Candidatus Omnitrophota bacterium]